MVQTVQVSSDGSFEFYDGFDYTYGYSNSDIPDELQQIIDTVVNTLSLRGASFIHVEKGNHSNFEHLIVNGDVEPYDFGHNVSSTDFDEMIRLYTLLMEQMNALPDDEAELGADGTEAEAPAEPE